ncbi:MAG: hypothetical protein J6L87_05680 [Clostridia bacterium]|nr:hypothetical protein [Clostridia bacterium]
MRDSRNKKTEYLLSEIGEIDDKFLLEAENYRPQRRLLLYRPLIAAACVCCFVAIVLTAVIRGGVLGKNASVENDKVNSSLKEDTNEQYSEAVTESTSEPMQRSIDLLCSTYSSNQKSYGSFGELERESGKTYILWRHVDGGRIFISRALTDTEVNYIAKHAGLGQSVGASSPELEFNVWILRGDGSIISPYLIGSGGNVGSALFDYEAEIMPEEELISLIEQVLASSTQN